MASVFLPVKWPPGCTPEVSSLDGRPAARAAEPLLTCQEPMGVTPPTASSGGLPRAAVRNIHGCHCQAWGSVATQSWAHACSDFEGRNWPVVTQKLGAAAVSSARGQKGFRLQKPWASGVTCSSTLLQSPRPGLPQLSPRDGDTGLLITEGPTRRQHQGQGPAGCSLTAMQGAALPPGKTLSLKPCKLTSELQPKKGGKAWLATGAHRPAERPLLAREGLAAAGQDRRSFCPAHRKQALPSADPGPTQATLLVRALGPGP